MARATKLAVELATAAGVPASRMQGWLERGYGPALDLAPRERTAYFVALASLTGEGRDGDVAVLKLAAQSERWPARRLRQVIRDLSGHAEAAGDEVLGADELVSYAMGAPHLAGIVGRLQSAARTVDPYGWADGDSEVPREPDVERVLVGSALLPSADALAGTAVDSGDTYDTVRVMDALFAQMLDVPAEDVDDISPEREEQQRDLVAYAAAAGRQGARWVDNASPRTLAQAVGLASILVDLLTALGVAVFPDEERWRWVGKLAPLAFPTAAGMAGLLAAVGAVPVDDSAPMPLRNLVAGVARMRTYLDDGSRDR